MKQWSLGGQSCPCYAWCESLHSDLRRKMKKMHLLIDKWHDRLVSGDLKLCHNGLISDRGFLVCATRPYLSVVPYLKGSHLLAETWCGNCNEEGWKLKVKSNQNNESSVGEDNMSMQHNLEEIL